MHYLKGELPTTEGEGILVRQIVGESGGLKSPVRTHSPVLLAHMELGAGAEMQLSNEYSERAVYVVSGTVDVKGKSFGARQLVVFQEGTRPVLRATAPTVLVLLGGEPVGERFVEWNFVSSSRDRIMQAKSDWLSGRTKLPDFDDRERIAMPGEPEASLPPA